MQKEQHEKAKEIIENCISKFLNGNKEKEIEQSQLAEFWCFLSDYKFESLELKFSTLTFYLMNFISLSVSGKRYRMTELEVYYYSPKENHCDLYAHKKPEQLSIGKWYFHRAGIDITFGKDNGNEENNVYGGILIRGIRELDSETPKYISGPLLVLKEIFLIGDIFTNRIFLQQLDKDEMLHEPPPIQTTRIRLKEKDEDNDKFFYNKNYRYIVDLNPEHKFPNKENVVRQLCEHLPDDEAKRKKSEEIIGHNVNKERV